MSSSRAVVIAVAALLASRQAIAEPAKIAAVTPQTTDVRKAVVVGPAGETYEPDGKGDWVRHHGGGIAGTVTGAAVSNGVAIVEVKSAPPFKLVDGAWTSIMLSPKPRAVLGVGPRVATAAGKNVFTLDGGEAKPLADLPARATALAASTKRVLAMTDKGVLEMTTPGTSWKPLKKLPKAIAIRSFLSDRFAVTDRGVIDLTSMKTITLPTGARIDAVTANDATIAAIAVTGARTQPVELIVLPNAATAAGKPAPRAAQAAKSAGAKSAGAKSAGAKVAAAKSAAAKSAAGAPSPFVREPTPFDGTAEIVALVVDDSHRVLVATRDGRIALRAAGAWDGTGTWSVTHVRDEIAPAKPGAGPARSASP